MNVHRFFADGITKAAKNIELVWPLKNKSLVRGSPDAWATAWIIGSGRMIMPGGGSRGKSQIQTSRKESRIE